MSRTDLSDVAPALLVQRLEWAGRAAAGAFRDAGALPCRVDEMSPREYQLYLYATVFAGACAFIQQLAEGGEEAGPPALPFWERLAWLQHEAMSGELHQLRLENTQLRERFRQTLKEEFGKEMLAAAEREEELTRSLADYQGFVAEAHQVLDAAGVSAAAGQICSHGAECQSHLGHRTRELVAERDRLARRAEQRDALLAACKALLAYHDDPTVSFGPYKTSRHALLGEQARAAVALAEKGAPP